MENVRLRGGARVVERMMVHCGCLGGGETMPVVGLREMEGNGSRMLIMSKPVLLFSSRVLLT